MSESPQLVKYRGNCHCGAFKFIFKAPELKEVFACNCSICSKKGYLWVLPARNEDFVVVKGEESALQTYEFGKRTTEHKFCPTCGTSVIARVRDSGDATPIGVNIRALADVDPASLHVLPIDAAAVEPLYQVPEPVAAGPVADGTTVYHGNCHCGAVRYTLLSPQKIATASECNCSICARIGALWIYPLTATITLKGLECLEEYTFATKVVYHGFCKICGVAIRARVPEDERKETALNLRAMNGLDLSALKITKENGKVYLPLYEAWEK
ncbi:Mss4-like protein [Mycena leptocephala]|nr:Mss4-like protein [Mycena leptocephala]